MADVRLDRLTKVYSNGFQAVTELSLELIDGEFMVLVGPSGCGKSTALRMIAGLEEITEGDLYVGDRRLNDVAPKDRDIAMVFQNYALYPQMTVEENIGFPLRLRKMKKAERKQVVAGAAEVLELTEQLDKKPALLSGGQRQRVAMGRAIVREPVLFLMDEPLSNLDAKLRVQMRADIAGIQRDLGATTFYVTHDQVEAMTLGDRVAVIKDGVLQQVAPPEELYDQPDNVFVAAFIGSPSMNLLDASVSADGGSVVLPGGERLAFAGPSANMEAGRPVILGLRPEHLEQAADGDGVAHLHVDVVEHLGADTIVHGHFGASRTDLTVRLPGVRRLQSGETLALTVKPAHVHLFDAESGARLGS